MIKLAISSCLQVLITITIFNTRNCVRNSWEIHSSSCFVEYPSLYPMWCFACCCFCQHPSSAHQDPWFFQHLRYSNFSKFSTLPSYRIRGATRSEIARHLLVWAYHEWCVRLYVRRAYEALLFLEISSQNTAAFCISCPVCEEWLWGCRDSLFGAKTTLVATKYDEERLAFFDPSFPTKARVIT